MGKGGGGMGLFYMGGFMVRSCQGDSLTNACSSSQNTVNLKVLRNYSGICTCRLSLNQSTEPWKNLHLRLAVMRFQRSYHVHLPLC